MNLSDTDTYWLFHTREIEFPVLQAIYHQLNELMFIIVWGNTTTILLYLYFYTYYRRIHFYHIHICILYIYKLMFVCLLCNPKQLDRI